MDLLQKLHVFGFDLQEVKLYTNIRCKRDNIHDWLIYITHDYSSINKIIRYKDKKLPLLFIFLVDDEEFSNDELEVLNSNDYINAVVEGDELETVHRCFNWHVDKDVSVCEFCVPLSWVGS